MTILIENLEEYRLENRITQERLAKQLGVSFTTVNRWFNGKAEPSKMQQFHIHKLVSENDRKTVQR